jgi:hypothetical protein
MSKANIETTDAAVWELPPLILHPFNERMPATALLEHSRAALMLSGVLPDDGTERDELLRRVLYGRYSEIRMLFYLGRDVLRWVDQCVEWAARVPEFDGDLRAQSFAGLLTGRPPEHVKQKLVAWGVADHASIFTRAIGLNAIFTEPPPLECLSADFLQTYHRFADAMFRCYIESQPHRVIGSPKFRFDLYASGEYSRMLESEWGAE